MKLDDYNLFKIAYINYLYRSFHEKLDLASLELILSISDILPVAEYIDPEHNRHYLYVINVSKCIGVKTLNGKVIEIREYPDFSALSHELLVTDPHNFLFNTDW